jgi:putative ABC transport system ATP-binding protein
VALPRELDGTGTRQARAVAGQRVLLLADEPTGVLDSLAGEAVLALLRGQVRRRHRRVLVTHETTGGPAHPPTERRPA